MGDSSKKFDTAAKRWEGIGPYYAMFPIRFAEKVISDYSSIGDTVLDPFAGRGTAVFSAAAMGRRGIGVEINPVGWVYAQTKLSPAPMTDVLSRLQTIIEKSREYAAEANVLPEFFQKCFSRSVLCFLLAARDTLDWRNCKCDRTLMAILLVYLHGKKGQALSNQMRQTKAMSPQYAINWWEKHGHEPPDLDIVDFLTRRIGWRYAKGVIRANGSKVYLGDSTMILPRISRRIGRADIPKATLLLTSPPYFGVTNYYYDQWLRLWLLGFETKAYVARGPHQGRFTNPRQYEELLRRVFSQSSRLVTDDAVIYVRTSVDPYTRATTLTAMREAFPQKRLVEQDQPFRKPTQTHLFGDKEAKAGEVDLILLP